MNCIYCGGKTFVEETASDSTTTYRKRICKECRMPMYTQESVKSEGTTELRLKILRQEQREKAVGTDAYKAKRRWEYAFQTWSNDHQQDNTVSYGACGYGSMCDYCEDVSYGRPCVRALNAMCRDKGLTIDYGKRDFEAIWRGEI